MNGSFPMLFQFPNVTNMMRFLDTGQYHYSLFAARCWKSMFPIYKQCILKHTVHFLQISGGSLQKSQLQLHCCQYYMHDWYQQLEEKKEVCAVFFDLRKAFDTVPHLPLMHKLQSLGVESYLLKWIHSYLTNRRR